MFSVVYWVLVMGTSVAVLVLAAAGRAINPSFGYAHLALAAGSVAILALFLIREIRGTIERGSSRNLVGAAKVRAMGTIWIWGAICLFATYATGVLFWSDWWLFTLPFVIIGLVCMFISILLKRRDEQGKSDEKLLRVLSVLAKVQIAAMLGAMLWLLVNGKMMRFLDSRTADWAAYNIFFFGAAVLGFLSLYAVSAAGQAKTGAGNADRSRPATIKAKG